MIKKTVTYTNYNGETVTKDFYFNFSTAEIAEMELEVEGGLSNTIKKISEAQDVPGLIKLFKMLLLRAYGVKSEDGERFIKNDELRASFEQSPAYSELFMSLATNDSAAADFINGIIPADLQQKVKEIENK